MTRPSPNDLYHACQDLVATGQPVFPCKSSGDRAKAPLGSLVPNGVKDATLDLERIKHWWRAQGSAAIGIATGILWDVLDVDIKEHVDGREHLTRLHTLGLLNGCQRVVRTPSGGWHLYFRATPGMTNKARGATLGLDVRGLGGYVLAPPSWLDAGPYEDHGPTDSSDLSPTQRDAPLYWNLIANELSPVDEDTKETIKLLPSERRSSVAALREFVSHLLPGERNNGFFWAVNRCIENGIDPVEMIEPATLIGLTEIEVNKSIDSALKRAGIRVEELNTEAEALFPAA